MLLTDLAAMLDPLSRYLHRRAGRHGPAMLMFHSVQRGDGTPAWPWAVSLQRFRAQLDLLASEGWDTPTLAELITSPTRWTGRTVVITFDDGYADNLAAVEELHRRSMRATFFVVSGSIGREPTWAANGRPACRLLDARALRDIHASGMEIGSHTVSHARLTQISDAHRQSELDDSRREIENVLGCAISSFAFPYGAWDQNCVQAVRQGGYRSACTTRAGWALRDGDPYTIRRLTMYNTDTVSTLARKLALGCNDVTWQTLSSRLLLRTAARLWKMPT